MNGSSELVHGALVFGFALIGLVGAPAAVFAFLQMMSGDSHGSHSRRLR